MELELQRRHSATCPDRKKGPHLLKCRGNCKLYAYGFQNGKTTFFSLKTSDLERAARRLKEWREGKEPAGDKKRLADAIMAFLAHKGNRQSETLRKYQRHLRKLNEYCAERGIVNLSALTIEALDPFVQRNRSRTVGWNKLVEHLRAFFKFCEARKWCDGNPANAIETEVTPERDEAVPYTQQEVARILAACDRVGKRSYERLRSRSMVLLLRYTGMRISDVITLRRDHVDGNYLKRKSIKNRRIIRIQLPAVVLQALENLPHPEAAPRDSQSYFAGQGSVRSLVKGAERLLSSVFRISGVPGAYPHRFRHTFASDLLAQGTPIEVVADMLGDSVDIVRKHYGKWTPAWQAKKDEAVQKLHPDFDKTLRQDLKN